MIRPTPAPFSIAASLVFAGLVCAQEAPFAPPQTETLPSAPQPLAECEVIARVNSEVILACDLSWQVELAIRERLGPAAINDHSPELDRIRRERLKHLTLAEIELVLLYADFRSNAPGADLPAIHQQLAKGFESQEVKRLIKNLGAKDRKDLDRILREVGTSVEERREDFYRTVIARQWLNQSIQYDKEVTHDQMLAYYQKNLEAYEQPNRARWEELMISFAKHPSKKEAYAALARLGNQAHASVSQAPADQPAFTELARSQSHGYTADEGGQHDWTNQGSLTAGAIDRALFGLPVGQMSPILEGSTGFHIVRVLERREAGAKPFREVQAAIRKGLHDERFTAAVREKLDELKQNAYLWTVFTGDLSAERLAQLEGGGPKRR